jgi:Flp pilus assembly protein TadD
MDEDRARSLFHEGINLFDAGTYATAESRFREALALSPGRPSVLTNLANTLLRQRKHTEALATAEAVMNTAAPTEQTLLIAASAHYELGHIEEALTLLDRLAALVPGNADVWVGRGSAFLGMGRFDEAREAFDRLAEIDPPQGHHQLAMLKLKFGYSAAAWAEHEWRLQRPDAQPAAVQRAAPAWHGGDVRGARMLLFHEQGHGDTLQFVRYAAVVAALGAKVTLLVQTAVRRLIAESFPNTEVIDVLPPDRRFDVRAPLMSLPYLLDLTTEHTIPRGAYLAANPAEADRWRARIGSSGLKIGIAWQGNTAYPSDRQRSIPLRAFAPLADVPGVRLISLQAQGGLDQLDDLPPEMTVERLGPEIESNPDGFRQLAAAMACVDVIVTSDSAPAHLAGALGRPTRVALRWMPDWRWQLERTDSPWYPTMRLVRQKNRGDWAGVFAEIADELRLFRT